jgi:ligand-binding sensor protein
LEDVKNVVDIEFSETVGENRAHEVRVAVVIVGCAGEEVIYCVREVLELEMTGVMVW